MTILKRMMVAMAALAGVMVLFAPSAFAHTSSSHSASNGGWTHLGGDPLVPGGVYSRASFVSLMTSSKGHTAMTYAGLNAAEIKAIVLQVREGNFKACTMNYGQKFWRMSFGINGTSVDRNVTFADPHYMGGAPAWCVTANVGGKGGYSVSVLAPKKCANVSVPKQPKRKLPKPKQPKKVKTSTTPSGNCNAVGSPGANVCSTVTYVNVCGTQVVYNGSQSDMQTWINNYIADHCAPTVTTGVCSQSGALNFGLVGTCVFPPSTPTPPPVQTCQTPGATNIGGPLPCQFPPPATPPSCTNVTTPQNGANGVFADGETYPGTVTVFGMNGDPLTVSFAAGLGSGSITSSPTFTSNGTDSASWLYRSPNDAGDVGKSDQITISVHDNKTGATASCSSGSFVLNASPEGSRP